MTFSVQNLLQSGAELTDAALERLLPSPDTPLRTPSIAPCVTPVFAGWQAAPPDSRDGSSTNDLGYRRDSPPVQWNSVLPWR